MERDIEIKTSLHDRMKEENARLTEKLQVRCRSKNESLFFSIICFRLKPFEMMNKNVKCNLLKKRIKCYEKPSMN